MTDFFVLFADSRIQWIMFLIILDYIIGFLGAIKNKEFKLGKVAKVMKTPVLSYLFGFVIIKAVAETSPMFEGVVPFAWLIIVAALVSSILTNLTKFNIQIPDWLKKE
ncbi:MAG: phage holin family protein [Minisyncoccales bacterium]